MRDPATKAKKQKREREDGDLKIEAMLPCPDIATESTKPIAPSNSKEPPAKRHKAAWRPPPEGTTLFQISMEKLHTKPVKGRRMQKELTDLMDFGDPEQTLREEKERLQNMKRWHKAVEVRRKSHRRSKKDRLDAWMEANDEAKQRQEEGMAAEAAKRGKEFGADA